MITRAAAFDTAFPFAKFHVAPLLRDQPAGLQGFVGILHFAAAMRADDAYQPLRQNAIQGGDKVVRLHAHIQEASQHVDYVIGVHSGEYQVAGQRGLDGNLRGFRVADFADHDLVRVVTQNRAQAAGKGQAFFFIDGNLRDSANLVLERVLNGDDLVFVALDFVQRRIQRGGLAAARRSGDQHHAVGFSNVVTEAAQVLIVKTDYVQNQVAKLLAHGFFIEHAQHGVFTVNGGHDGNAEVDQPVVVLDAEAAVLGHATLGNVEFAHDLDAGDDGRVMFLGHRRHGLLQHAVNAVLDLDGLALRFYVDVTGAFLQRGENGGVHQTNDRTGVGCKAVNRDVLVSAAFFITHQVQRETFAGFFQNSL